ncbi:MAG: hypothetical protein AAFX39_15920 [Pseudomonadota bacterium]
MARTAQIRIARGRPVSLNGGVFGSALPGSDCETPNSGEPGLLEPGPPEPDPGEFNAGVPDAGSRWLAGQTG